MKCYAWNGVLSYVRFDDPNRGIDLNAFNEFPRAFSSDGVMDYGKAIKASLEKRLVAQKFKKLEVI